MARQSIEEVQAAHQGEWMALPGVEGVGIGRCGEKPCLKVFASRQTEEMKRIPSEVEGYEVRVEISGLFRAEEQE